MPKPEWGTKRVCPACSAKFYDLQKSPAECPKCGNVFEPEVILKPRRTKVAEPKEEVAEPEENEDEDEDEDEDVDQVSLDEVADEEEAGDDSDDDEDEDEDIDLDEDDDLLVDDEDEDEGLLEDDEDEDDDVTSIVKPSRDDD